MDYIVTGGAGFIGSTLVEYLLKNNHNITVVDNLHTGSLQNLSGLLSKIKFIQGDIKSITREMFENADGIFHLGIPSSTPMYRNDKNLVGKSINEFLYLMNNYNKKIVFASSSSVYNKISPPHTEDANILPTDFYTEARLSMERLAQICYEMYGDESIALRLFSVYGYNEINKRVYANMISQFIWNILNKDTPIIYGDGSQTRDFTWVEDVAKAFSMAMESNLKCDILNVGTGIQTSFNELIQLINDLTGMCVVSKYVDNPIQNYVSETQANVHKMESLIGFKSIIGIRDGVRIMLNHYGIKTID